MIKKEYALQRLLTDEDVEQNLELMRNVFIHDVNIDPFVRKLLSDHPTMKLNDFFAIKHQGKIVAGLNLIPLEWSVGGVLMKVAELGCVATLPEYRRQGLQRRLIRAFHKQAAEQEYDLCAIEGIPFFYRQFGYEYALPLDEETRIELDRIPDYQGEVNVRPFTARDIPEAMRLLTECQSKFYVHSIRDERIWKMQQETGLVSADRFEGYVFEKDGKTLAYIRMSENPQNKELILREASDIDRYVGKAILKFLRDVGRQRGLDTLLSRLSHYDSLTDQLIALGGTERTPPYAWQIRIVNYLRILQKMKPLFESRLAASASHRNLNETLTFNFYRFIIEVSVENGKITDIREVDSTEDRAIRLNPLVFAQLLLGHRSREELEMTYPDFLIRPSHKNLIDVLFPKLPSYIHCTY
jgi:predicted acetyltransferase